jgi:hypothetical protein
MIGGLLAAASALHEVQRRDAGLGKTQDMTRGWRKTACALVLSRAKGMLHAG